MNRQELRLHALKRMEMLEEVYADRVPPEAMHLYRLLNALYVADFRSYAAQYGPLTIDPNEANDASLDLGWGPISPFEKEVCEVINRRCRELESPLSTQSVRVRAIAI